MKNMPKDNKPKYDEFADDPFGAHKKIVKLVGNKKKVLDVGCSTGKVSEKFKNNGCEVVGIELNKQSAKIAKQYCKQVIVQDIESDKDLMLEEEYFDIIVFADVLEHLKNPKRTILKLKRYLKSDGSIVISLPNVANYTIRINLLLGKFNYEERGILDFTHLRFFTKESTKELIESSGFEIINFDITPSFPFPISSKYKYILSKFRPNLFARQYIVKGKKMN